MRYLNDNPREKARHYIPTSDEDISAMLKTVGKTDLSQLFDHIPNKFKFPEGINIPKELSYEETMQYFSNLADKNQQLLSFIADGLPDFQEHEIVPHILNIRNLTTAYTPYQPERSQGTLIALWIYQCLLSKLTGFEAINSSLYDISTALFEAINCAMRVCKNKNIALVAEAIYPGSREVLETLIAHTNLSVKWISLDPKTGRTDSKHLAALIREYQSRIATIAFPQVNSLGLLEDVDQLADMTSQSEALITAIVDPALLATGGLKPPAKFGVKGADIVIGEAQHLALKPNFGGPGLGLFGVRHNKKTHQLLRATPGRFVGKAKDAKGRDCYVIILSTREQHIRKDKATSNICSNQAYIATIAGAVTLVKGEAGMTNRIDKARRNAVEFVTQSRAELAYPDTPFFNEICIVVDNAKQFIEKAYNNGILAGVDVSTRTSDSRQLVKISFSDKHQPKDLKKLIQLISNSTKNLQLPSLPAQLLRHKAVELPTYNLEAVKKFYNRLGKLNVSPDNRCYPLGSCTMKYNPYLNDWAASLKGFCDIHPQAPEFATQGCLEVLYEIQQWFKEITGLAAVTTQPVAGAQGELLGLKLFQAYHFNCGETHRDIIFIPKNAHGTNFATASIAGFVENKKTDKKTGIVLLNEGLDGEIDFDHFRQKLQEYGDRLCGIMITNPNTCGIFETRLKEISDAVHSVGGLVYMDGANMNAIAGWLNFNKLGIDALHSNLHKTWTIPHGGGGPGDAIVAVNEKLMDYLPGHQVHKHTDGTFSSYKTKKSIGSLHRHWGNFAHKVRCLAYLKRLGKQGIPKMSSLAVLSSVYLFKRLKNFYPTLPAGAENAARMHEFILTLNDADFGKLQEAGITIAKSMVHIGKLFLDYGFHSPTISWPEQLGIMIEPTESYTKMELDRFCEAVIEIKKMVEQYPKILKNAPYFTPVDRIDEVAANRNPQLNEDLTQLPRLNQNRIEPEKLARLSATEISKRLLHLMDSIT